ncbi:hypothetical protein EMCRGX_G004686, partial [Ephydatia muelleri]
MSRETVNRHTHTGCGRDVELLKRLMRERTMHSNLFDTYLPEFMWRRRFSGPETFSNIAHMMYNIRTFVVCVQHSNRRMSLPKQVEATALERHRSLHQRLF